MNRIIKVELTLDTNDPNGSWLVTVTKEFAPEHGGGQQQFTERAGQVHHALDVARGMVTLHPANAAYAKEKGWVEVPSA